MTGKAYVSTFQYYDIRSKKMSFKSRPVLVIGQADTSDYVVLPISRVTNKANLDDYYDVPIDPTDAPKMNLKQLSYVRTYKQTVVNAASLTKEIIDFRTEYEEIYLKILSKVEEFQSDLIKNAI